MASPYLVVAVGMLTLVALAAISVTSSNQMNWSLTAQQAMKIQADKASEDLAMEIKNNTLTVQNNVLDPIVLKEIRLVDGEGNKIAAVDYSGLSEGGYKLGAFDRVSLRPANFSQVDFFNKKIIAISDLGNVFSASNLDDFSSPEAGGGKAMMNGMGLNSRIIQAEKTGAIIYGQGMMGRQESLEPYITVPPTTNFAAELLDGANVVSTVIPKFNTKYRYESSDGSLGNIGHDLPNILGFSEARIVGGVATATQGSYGIIVSGTGTVILKLNKYSQDLILEGSVPEDSSLFLGTNMQYDYMSIPYSDSYGFKIYSGALPAYSYSQNGCNFVNRLGYRCNASFTYVQQFLPALLASSTDNFVSIYSDLYRFSITGVTQNPHTYSVSSVTYVEGASSGWHAFCCQYPTTSSIPAGGQLVAYDKEIIMNNKVELGDIFQTTYTFSNLQHYLVIKPNGATVEIRGTAFDPNVTPVLEIENLPPNTPFQIEKSGKTGASGMTSDNGHIMVTASQFQLKDTAMGGVLHLYPDSLSYRGQFSTVVFDNVNGQTLHIDDLDDKIYVAHAYVNIPVIGDVEITDVQLDGSLTLDYLQGNYTTGNNIKVPIIPGYRNIDMKINGIQTTTVIANVLGGVGLKVIRANTSTITSYVENNAIPSIGATAGATSYVVATSEGTMTTSLTATISGDSEIENHAYFGSPPPQPTPPPPRDPLKAYVEVYKNGALVRHQQIYFNANPTVLNTGQTTGSSSSVTAKYTYPQTVVNGVVMTNVLPGDFIEFYLYASIEAEGALPPVPPGHTLYHYSGEGYATAAIHSGNILAS
jgi:hypothetical protein